MSVKYFHMGQWPCFVGFTTDKVAFAREMKRLKIKDVDFFASARANATTHCFINGNTPTMIITILPGKGTREQQAAMIAHEAQHVVQYIREEFNGHHDFGVENEAYLLQYIVQSCLQELWKTKRVMRTRPT